MNRVGILKQILVICNVLGTSSGYSMDNNTYSSPIKSFNRNFFVKSNGQSPVKSDAIVKQQLLNQQDDIKELEGYIRELFRKLNNLSTDVTGNKIVISEVISKMQNDKQIEELLKKVDELSYEVSVLTDSDNNEIPLLKSKISDLSTQLNQFDWKIDEVSNNSEKVTELLEEVKELSDKLKKNDKLIGDMIDDIQGLSDKIGNNNNKELSEEVKELSIKVNNSNNNEQITELLNKVNELSDKVNILSNQDNSQEDNSQEDTSQEDNNNEQVNQLLKEVKELSDKVNDFAKDILNATVNSTLAHDKVKSFTEQFSEKIDNLSKQVNGLEKNKADIKDLSKNVQQDIQSLMDNLHSVQTDISSCWFNLTELSKQVTSDNSNNNEQNNKQNEVIQKNINDIKDLRKDIGSLIDNVNEFGISSKRSSNILGDRMNDIENKVKQLELDKNKKENQTNNQEQIENLKLYVTNNLWREQTRLQSLIRKSMENISSLKENIRSLQSDQNVSIEKIKQLEQLSNEVNNNKQVELLQKQVDDLNLKVNNSSSNNNEQVEKLLEQVNKLSSEVTDLSNQVNDDDSSEVTNLSNQDNSQDNSNKMLKKQIEELSNQINNLSTRYNNSNDSHNKQIRQLLNKIKDLSDNMKSSNTKPIEKLFMHVHELYDKVKWLDNKVNNKGNTSKGNASSNNNEQIEQIKQLSKQLEQLLEQVNDLSNKVNDLSKQVNNSNGSSNNNNEQVKRLLKKVNDLSKQVNNSNGSNNNNEQVKRLLKKVSDLSNQVNNNNNGSNNYEQIEQLLKQVNNLSKKVKKVNDSNVNDKLDTWELSSLSIRMKNLENLFRNVNRNVFVNINNIYEQMEKQVDEKVDERIGKLQKQVDDFYNILSTSFESLDNLKNELNIKDIREQIVLFLEKNTKKYTLSSSQYCFYKERIYKDRNGIIKDLFDKKLINHTVKNTNDAKNTNDTYEISNKITDVDYFKYLIEINSFALDNYQIIIKRLEDNLKNILSNSLFKNNIQFMVDKIEKQSNDLKIIIGEYKELEIQVLNLLNTNKARNENLNKTFNEIASKYKITNKKVEDMYNNFYQFLIIKHA